MMMTKGEMFHQDGYEDSYEGQEYLPQWLSANELFVSMFKRELQ